MHSITDTIQPLLGETHRTACGVGRVSYHPEWSTIAPWVTYWDGAAGRHFATLQQAAAYFSEKRHARLVVKR
jgi:hypothetical protein